MGSCQITPPPETSLPSLFSPLPTLQTGRGCVNLTPWLSSHILQAGCGPGQSGFQLLCQGGSDDFNEYLCYHFKKGSISIFHSIFSLTDSSVKFGFQTMMIYKWKALLCWLFTSLRLTASQVVLVVKNLPASTGDLRDMGQEDPWRRAWQPTHSSILAWRIPWTEKPGGLQSMGSQIVRHDLKQLSMHTY